MKKLLSIALLCAAAIAAPLAAHADPLINGSFGFTAIAASSTDHLNSDAVITTGPLFTTGESGNFPVVPPFTSVGPGSTISLANPSVFSIVFGSFGTFTENTTYGAPELTYSQSGTGLIIFLFGDFTSTVPGYANNTALLTLSFSDSGTFTASGSLQTPIPPTPEPSSILLLGTGLIGMAFFMRRRFAL